MVGGGKPGFLVQRSLATRSRQWLQRECPIQQVLTRATCFDVWRYSLAVYRLTMPSQSYMRSEVTTRRTKGKEKVSPRRLLVQLWDKRPLRAHALFRFHFQILALRCLFIACLCASTAISASFFPSPSLTSASFCFASFHPDASASSDAIG